eukprot:gene10059-7186_t
MAFDWTILYIVGPVFVFISCIICCIVAYFRCFIVDRTKAPPFFLAVKYFTEHPDVELDDINFRSSMNKIRRRKQRIRRINDILRASKVKPQTEEDIEAGDDGDSEDVSDEDAAAEADAHEEGSEIHRLSSKSMSIRRSMLFLRKSFLNFMALDGFSQKSSGSNMTGKSKKRRKSGKSRSSSFLSQSGGVNVSTKSKRFISQDRLDRAEARKALFAQTEQEEELDVEDVHEEEIDERELRVREIIERRKRQREEEKLDAAEKGMVDVVALNAGPRASEVPRGFAVVEFIADLDPAYLIYKRVLYKHEDPTKACGWFLGTIVGESKATGKNFNIKYDRAETGTRFVDGMQSVSLAMEGENAYGRRWVIIEWKGPGKRPGKILAILAKGQSAKESPAPLVKTPSKKLTPQQKKDHRRKQRDAHRSHGESMDDLEENGDADRQEMYPAEIPEMSDEVSAMSL